MVILMVLEYSGVRLLCFTKLQSKVVGGLGDATLVDSLIFRFARPFPGSAVNEVRN